MIGFPINPVNMTDVQRGFQKIARAGILDGVLLIGGADGRYTINVDGTTLSTIGGKLAVNVDGTTLGIPAGGTKLAVLSPLGGCKNFVINPLFDFWQRTTSKAFAAGGGTFYTADRWLWQWTSTTAAGTVAQAVDVPDTTATYSLKVTSTGAEASLTAGTNLFLGHVIEGTNLRNFLGRTVTLSFWVKSSLTGTYCVSFGNAAVSKVNIAEYTINAANTWEFKTVTFVSTTAGAWNYDSNSGMRIRWCLAAGSTYQGSLGFNLTNVLKTANQVNFFGATTRTWQIAKVQFEIGPTASDFEFRPPTIELQLCQRYFETSYPLGTAIGAASNLGPCCMPNVSAALAASTAGNISPGGQMQFLVAKRANPTITVYDFDGTAGAMRIQGSVNAKRVGAASFGNPQSSGLFQYIAFDNTGALAIAKNDMVSFHWTADCELT
jgi:hypothetical protein